MLTNYHPSICLAFLRNFTSQVLLFAFRCALVLVILGLSVLVPRRFTNCWWTSLVTRYASLYYFWRGSRRSKCLKSMSMAIVLFLLLRRSADRPRLNTLLGLIEPKLALQRSKQSLTIQPWKNGGFSTRHFLSQMWYLACFNVRAVIQQVRCLSTNFRQMSALLCLFRSELRK